ncbi:hypothetical protein LZZ85_15615 [Terrimonas sp. NA20]|uniref:Glyoxalase/bleomycin resistance/extradiol dioxygenase family protein n=1 Tax=Terrimonas ginsenosidimutans TaxID=2908004 RepID=A0ABS9KTR5_9BACT|nr:hypothetical protein [Terrimonas ginsenosidimutans]MCG2615727.1 hypothetical protein [Terrimonas ginsenosidimutans]
METTFLHTVPVFPSQDIIRDVQWYQEKMGMSVYFADNMYAVLYRENLILHLQWHADTADDPLLGGSVVRILVKNIQPIFEEFQERGCITADKLRVDTPWNTTEFGFFDLNSNAIFLAEDTRQ